MTETSLISYLQWRYNLSRRKITDMIKKNKMYINGKIVESFNTEVFGWEKIKFWHPVRDNWVENEIEIKAFRTEVFIVNKPKGCVVSSNDPHNKTVFELLPNHLKKGYYYVGRLDKESHGLLLLTNDTKLVDKLENPKNGVKKVYEVTVNHRVFANDISMLIDWIYVDQRWVKMEDINDPTEFPPIERLSAVSIDYNKNYWEHIAEVVLTSWKKRHIRRMFRALWYNVLDLKRTAIWGFTLWNLAEGRASEVKDFRLKIKKS